MTRMAKTLIDWYGYGLALEELAHSIHRLLSNYQNYQIVGLKRGGLIPAVFLSHKLGMGEVFTLGASHYTRENTATDSVQLFDPPFVTGRMSNKILLVDDLLDSGATLNAAITFLEETFAMQQHTTSDGLVLGDCLTIITAVVYTKMNPERARFAAHFGGKIMSNEWIVFPYEATET